MPRFCVIPAGTRKVVPYSQSADDVQPNPPLPEVLIPKQPESKEPSSKTAKSDAKPVIGHKMSPKGPKGSSTDHTAQGHADKIRDEDDHEQAKVKSKRSPKKPAGKKAVKAKGGGPVKKAGKAKQSPPHQAVHKQRKVAEPSGSEEGFNDTISWLKYLDKDEHEGDGEKEDGDEGQRGHWEDEEAQRRLTHDPISTLRAIWGHGDESEDDGEQAGDNRGRRPTDNRSEGDVGQQAFEDGDGNGEWDGVYSGDDLEGSESEVDGGGDTIRYKGNRPRASRE